MDEEDYAISQLLLNAASPSPLPESPAASPALSALPQVERRPISKRRGKKRSSRACGACRVRKVRCNIVAHGAPCSNCRHDEVDCVLPLSRRQKTAREKMERAQMEHNMRAASSSADFQDCMKSVERDSTPETILQRSTSARRLTIERSRSTSESQLAPHGMAISEHPLAEILPVTSISLSHPAISRSRPKSLRTKAWIQIASPLASAPEPQLSSSEVPRLPQIFAPFPRHLDIHDLSYLHSRGALTLPPEPLQIALLKAYVEFVHPSFPLLDTEEFLSMAKYGLAGFQGEKGKGVERESAGKKQIPFLLFQAVMFAAVEFVSLELLKEVGYKSREDAKTAFFARVRLLYDFDTTTHRLSIIQSLLLMTLSTSSSMSSDDGKDAWHWMGLAISLSYSLGLHRSNGRPSSEPRQKHLERRVWWTIFMRDRSLAVSSESGCARPMRIRRVDCDIEMLCMEDFELGKDNTNDKDNAVADVKMRCNAQACIEKAMLCWCCDEMLVSSHSPAWTQPAPPRALYLQSFISPPISQFPPNMELDVGQPFQTTSFSEQEFPAFESQEDLDYHITPSSSTSSADDNCITPREYDHDEFVEVDDHPMEDLECRSPLGAGYGVDGEYDDYLEFLRGPVISKGTGMEKENERERSSRAFQLDYENGRIVELKSGTMR